MINYPGDSYFDSLSSTPVPLFSFRIQLDTAAATFLEVWGSIVDESINNRGLRKFPPWSKPFGPL